MFRGKFLAALKSMDLDFCGSAEQYEDVFRFIDYQLIKIQYSGQIALCTSFHGWFSIITVVNFKRAFRYFFPTAIRTNRNR